MFLQPGKVTKADRAEAWLFDQFTDVADASTDGGTIPAKDLEARAKRDGHEWRTVQRALQEMGGVSEQTRDKNGKVTGWVWQLPRPRF